MTGKLLHMQNITSNGGLAQSKNPAPSTRENPVGFSAVENAEVYPGWSSPVSLLRKASLPKRPKNEKDYTKKRMKKERKIVKRMTINRKV